MSDVLIYLFHDRPICEVRGNETVVDVCATSFFQIGILQSLNERDSVPVARFVDMIHSDTVIFAFVRVQHNET